MKNLILILVSVFFMISCQKESSVSNASSDFTTSNTGKNGSMAKYTFSGNYLYVVEGVFLHIYDASNAQKPVQVNTINLNNPAVETIFPYGENLFFGTQNGLLIYTIKNPEVPEYVSTYTHVVSCDPVVVEGTTAYVTLSTGTACGRGINQLELIDISNLSNPRIIRTFPLNNPKGMAIDNGVLYVCDGNQGLKVFNVKNNNPVIINTIEGIQAIDVIKNGNVLTVTAINGIFQYDCTNPANLIFLSKISN